MSFFESNVVREEMTEIMELQEDVYNRIFQFPQMETDDKIEHVEKLERLLEKQRIMYTRLSLSDDPDAKIMKANITKAATMMGMPKDIDMNLVWKNMNQVIGAMRSQIDSSSNS